MTNFIPLFPLGIVVYPGEELNLHIFEERYKQLITECFAENKPFGIPVVISEKVMDYGAMVTVSDVFEVYKDGKMDIRTKGLGIFRMLEIIKEVPGKLFSGAIVTHQELALQTRIDAMPAILQGIRELHKLLNITKQFKKPDEELISYDIAHHAGLNLEEEYELLQLVREDQRQEYLKRHLAKVLPIIAGMDALKEKVKLNGHFRDLKGFEF
ncbi:MAG: LON peptidase substrate-binding domain-containing protein [Chitinophagaceae bacterium]